MSGNIRKDSVEILVTTRSKALQDALNHYNGSIDVLLEDLLKTWLESFEDANFEPSWNMKQAIFGRNGLRKRTMENFRKWMKGEIV